MSVVKCGTCMTLTVLAWLISANVSEASPLDGHAPASTIEACVAEIDDRANFEGATRVRHEVDAKKRRSIGHKLRIESIVFDDNAGTVLREYATTCVVTRGTEPYRFRMEEISKDL